MKTSRFLLLAVCAAALASCEQKTAEAPPIDPTLPAPVAAEPVPPASKVIPLTSEGFGPLTIGMSEADADAAIGGFTPWEASKECHYRSPKDTSLGLLVMFEDGLISSIRTSQGSTLVTDRAIGLGMTEARVRTAYPEGLEEELHKYRAPPAKRLIKWDKPPVRGVLYEIDESQKVISIHAGGPSIRYVEGCS